MSRKKMNLLSKVGLGLVGFIIVLCVGFYVYTLDYYRASDYVQGIIDTSNHQIEVDGNLTVIQPEFPSEEEVGLIFYPGGKVEANAYMPLLLQLADEGITCVLVKMPMNLAVFNINGADEIIETYPDMEWYLAGHSLGGAMASSYVGKKSDLIEGLILLGAYPLNEADVNTLMLYGSYDLLVDLSNLYLADEAYEIIDGNHAQFGDYGVQEGDGEAKISREEQQKIAVDHIRTFILE